MTVRARGECRLGVGASTAPGPTSLGIEPTPARDTPILGNVFTMAPGRVTCWPGVLHVWVTRAAGPRALDHWVRAMPSARGPSELRPDPATLAQGPLGPAVERHPHKRRPRGSPLPLR